jgi:hypothetical protein
MPKTSTTSTIDRAEWDFSRCPDDRGYLAYTYEYGRQIPEIIERFNHDRAHNPAAFDPLGTWHHVVVSEMPTGSLRVSDPETPEEAARLNKTPYLEVIDAPAGFPDTPYLQTTHLVMAESYSPFVVGEEPVRVVIVNKNGGYEAADPYHPDPPTPEQVVHFEINRRYTDHAILQWMAQWLKKTRGDQKSLERRGTSEITRCHADLKALGAVRLMEHFGSAEEARDHTAKLGVGNGLGLYANLAEWSEAKKRVRLIIEQWLKP